MEEEKLKAFALQLRKPEGEFGLQVGLKMNEGNLYINKNTIEELNPELNDHVLEIGMGNGYFVKEILELNGSIRYTGCDYSAEMVEEAEKMNENYVNKKRAKFLYGKAENLPLEDNTVDKLFTINTLYFWDNPTKILDEFRRVLKPAGKLLVSVRPKNVMEQIPVSKYGFTVYAKEDIVDLLRNNDFKVVKVVEKEEPAQSFDDHEIKMETLIVIAVKN